MALTFKFRADGAEYARGLEKMRSQTKAWAGGVKGIIGGLLGAGIFAQLGKQAISFGSTMTDLADRTKTSVSEFMALRDAARDAGVTQESLERGLRNVALRSEKAMESNNDYRKSLTSLGIDYREFQKLTVAEKFVGIAEASHAATNRLTAMKNVASILGDRSGPQLTEVLRRLATEGFDAVKASAVVMDDATAKSLDAAEDRIQKFLDKIKIATGNIIGAVGSVLYDDDQDKKRKKADRKMELDRIHAVGSLEDQGVEFSKKESNELIAASTSAERIGEIMERHGKTRYDFYRAIVNYTRLEKNEQEEIAKKERDKLKISQEKLELEAKSLETQGEIKKAKEALAKAEAIAADDALSNEQRRNKLIAERGVILASIENNKPKEGTEQELQMVKDRLRLLTIAKELRGTEKKIANDKKTSDAEKKKKITDEKDKKTQAAIDEELDLFFGGSKWLDAQEADMFDELNNPKRLSTEVISSALGSIGGGGGVAMFTNDPAVIEAKRQTDILQKIETHLDPSGGLNTGGRPEL